MRLLQNDPATGDSLLYSLEVWPPQLLTRAPRFRYGSVSIVGDALLSTGTDAISLYAGLNALWTRAEATPWAVRSSRQGQLRALRFLEEGFEWTAIDPGSGETIDQRVIVFPAAGGNRSVNATFASERVDWFGLWRDSVGQVMAVPRGQPSRTFALSAQKLVPLPDGAAVVSWLQDEASAQPRIQVGRLQVE